jgi:NADP-dependent 3-hydroxy acid dehydrogenase YdfG
MDVLVDDGRDIWVNNAGVTLFARVDEGPLEVHRRVIESYLLGYLYGARVAVRIFREQGRGVLVNVSSAPCPCFAIGLSATLTSYLDAAAKAAARQRSPPIKKNSSKRTAAAGSNARLGFDSPHAAAIAAVDQVKRKSAAARPTARAGSGAALGSASRPRKAEKMRQRATAPVRAGLGEKPRSLCYPPANS